MPDVVVANFNMHWGLDTKARPYDVVETVRTIDPDVIGLQEVWRPHGGHAMVDDAAAAIGATVVEVVLAPDTMQARPRHIRLPPGPPGTWGVAILTRLPVLRRFEIDLGHAPGDPVPRRIAICAELDAGGTPFVFAAVHASHRIYGSPPQLRRLARALDAEGFPNVISGDCNMWGAVLAPLLRGRRRAVRGATWPAKLPHSQIDHLWVSEGVVVGSGEVLARTPSDHRPIRARIRVGR